MTTMPAARNKVVRREAKQLRVHPTAQREIVKAKLNKIADNLDLDAIGTLHAAEYAVNGEFATWVIDGQHRLMAMLQRGLGDWMVDVMIHTDCHDDKRASELFLDLNFRTPLTAVQRYISELQAGRPRARHIDWLLRQRGYAVAAFTSENKMNCAASLESIYDIDHHGTVLGKTLDVTTMAWGHVTAASEGKLLEGIARVIAANDGKCDDAILAEKLAKYPGGPAALIGSAKGLRNLQRGTLARSIADIVVNTYNKGRTVKKLQLP